MTVIGAVELHFWAQPEEVVMLRKMLVKVAGVSANQLAELMGLIGGIENRVEVASEKTMLGSCSVRNTAVVQLLSVKIEEADEDDCDKTFAIALTVLIEYSEGELHSEPGRYANMLIPGPLKKVSASFIRRVHEILGIFPAGD